jgi:hypothetical protein
VFTGQARGFLIRIGIDRAIAYSISGRAWALLAGPVGLYLIATFLTKSEQGYYYTFGSVLGLTVFFELGLSYVIVQFTSHEMAGLKWSPEGILDGDPTAKARLASLLRLALKWYGIVSLLTVTTVGPIGYWFFARKAGQNPDVVWQAPWIWVVSVTGFTLCTTPLFALLEGCGLVAEVGRVRLCQQVAGNLMLWLALCAHWSLLATPIVNSIALLVGWSWLVSTKRHALADLLSYKRGLTTFGWWSELFPMQWKIALSWLSGYLICQLFTPVLFSYHGAAAAGQMGFSMSMTNALVSLGGAWINTKAPAFGQLIARRDFRQLDAVFFRALKQSLAVVCAAGVVLWLCVGALHLTRHPLSQRMLPPLPFAALVGVAFMNHLIGSEAVYLRAHKQEPFLWNSLVAAGCMMLSTYFLGRYYGATGIVLGYFVITGLLGLTWATWVFVRKRHEWHDRQG